MFSLNIIDFKGLVVFIKHSTFDNLGLFCNVVLKIRF